MLRKLALLASIVVLANAAGCASTAKNQIVPVDVTPVAGELIDQQRLTDYYKIELGSDPYTRIIADAKDEDARWLIQPNVMFERGGMGVKATLRVSIKYLPTDRWVATRTYSSTQWVGPDNRDQQVRDLLSKSTSWVRHTLKGL